MKDLLADYNPSALPEPEQGIQTKIDFRLEVMGIAEVNAAESYVKLKASVRQWWKDKRLSWNTTKYGGINQTWFKSDPQVQNSIWIPDTYLQQDVGEGYLSNQQYTDIRVNSDGTVYWSRFGDLKILVTFDVGSYPYDEQTINMTFGSWIYPDNRIMPQFRSNPLYIYDTFKIDHIEWNIVGSSYQTLNYVFSTGSYQHVNYQLQIRRKGNTLVVSVIVPCFLVGLASTFYYFLPKGQGERANYLATILLTEIMFLVMISQILPMSTQIPFMGYFFLSISCTTILLILIVLLVDKKERQLERLKYKKRKERKQAKKMVTTQSNTSPKDHYGSIQSIGGIAHRRLNHNDSSKELHNSYYEDHNPNNVSINHVHETQGPQISLPSLRNSFNISDLLCLKINTRKRLRKLDQIIALVSTFSLIIMMASMMGVILG
eukprot:403358130